MFCCQQKKVVSFLIIVFLLFAGNLFCLDNTKYYSWSGLITDSFAQKTENPEQTAKDNDYIAWKEKYAKTKKQMKNAKILSYFGLSAVLGGVIMGYLSRSTKMKGGSSYSAVPGSRFFTIKTPSVPSEEYNTGLLIGAFTLIGVGGTLAIVGSINKKKSDKQKKTLEEEGKVKGYLKVNANPVTKHFFISYTLEF